MGDRVRLDQDLQRLIASDPEAMRDAYDVWTRLREEAPVYRDGAVVYVTKQADVRALLKDLKHFSTPVFSDYKDALYADLSATYTPEQLDAFVVMGEFEENYMNRSGDGDTHARLRRIAHRYFTPGRIADMRESILTYTHELFDEYLSPAGDNGTDLMPLAYRLPLIVICDMLGVPPEDRELVHGWSTRLGRNRRGMEPLPLMDAQLAMGEFRDYVAGILVRHRENPDAVSPLVASLMDASEDERLTEVELTAMFVILLFAGHETTTNLIANGTAALMANRDQWEQLCADPGLARNANEELLRFVSPVQWLFRDVQDDYTFDGTTMYAGERVLVVLAAANRDPDVFADPDRLDLSRDNANSNVALGLGVHFCLGQALARLEGEVVFEQLARRFPDLRMDAAPEDLVWRGHAMLRGINQLPVVPGVDRARPTMCSPATQANAIVGPSVAPGPAY